MISIKFEVPLFVTKLYNDEGIEVSPSSGVARHVSREISWAHLEEYSNGLIESYYTTVEGTRLFITASARHATIDEIVQYFDGQFSDGWGESFEQEPFNYQGNKLYVSTWRDGWRADHPAEVIYN